MKRPLPLALTFLALALWMHGADRPLTKLTVQLDWMPEPEHGGFYQAQALGFFREEGLDVTLLPGGPNALVMPKVATGRADIGQADSTNTLLQQAEGLPVLQFAAVFQDDPSGLLVNAASSVHRFEDLQGKTIIARPEWAFLAFLEKKYQLKFAVVPQTFSVAAFLGNKEAIQQGYFIAEPHHIVKAGGEMPRFLSTWDAGFRAYAVLVTSRKFARDHPDALRAFVRAYLRGWRSYLEEDPTPAHAALKAANPSNTDEFMAFSRQKIIAEKLVTGRDASGGVTQIGRLDPARFDTQIRQLEELGILKPGKVTTAQAITTDFVP
ncbi:ABC transporter substrate-binding protein [Opitutus terrae]|uniref:NMT1/THI5 like domain protein n=1 Tax=Opitutus terrae (strain DSM 11246 / JCM 15787 / PB90-1) TaxID=452637 RepID=B1ZW88_OPITP|nr:ABC transporter substrate-binding protein [Opitutus terrae]ACB76840.1 NMT1/THI5 like domain protein [Opitutus terrae PB90-1]